MLQLSHTRYLLLLMVLCTTLLLGWYPRGGCNRSRCSTLLCMHCCYHSRLLLVLLSSSHCSLC
jgi:hypothetical protein